jgi:hypothetical protein
MEIFYQYIKTNREPFIAKVQQLSNLLGIQPEWMLAVMFLESRINEKAVNPVSGATGLIQFMPNTARGLGTTTDALKNMSNIQQLDYVYSYFKPYAGRMKNLIDVYFAVFFPIAMNKPDDWVLETKTLSAALIARQNPAYDLNKDGKITVGEVKQAITNILKKNSITI